MSEPVKTEPAAAAKPRRHWFVLPFIVLTGLVCVISLWTNLSRMYGSPPAQAKTEQAKTDQAKTELAQAAPARPLAQGFERLEIVSGTTRHAFAVEVMRTDAEKAKGLMFRQSMPADEGMLFDFSPARLATMWMKNTYIPLDMLFIRGDGVIHRIEHRTEPHSERTISSGAPVSAVLELNAGVSEKLGLKPGDKVIHPFFPAK